MHRNVHSNIIYDRQVWKQPKCPLTDDWMKNMWYIYSMEYYSAMKGMKILLFPTTWMNLEAVMLSEISQTDKYCIISLICRI